MADRWFIDTGAWFARFYRRDIHHREAVKIWSFIEKENIIAVSTNHVLDELATLLARRTDYEYSGSKMEKIYDSDIRIERSSVKDELNALAFFRKYADQKVSFTDCLSFAIMKKLNMRRPFTFDRHFEYAGFEIVLPSKFDKTK